MKKKEANKNIALEPNILSGHDIKSIAGPITDILISGRSA